MAISLFTDPSRLITIKIFCAIDKTSGEIVCDPDRDTLLSLYKDSIDPGAIEEQSMAFRTPSYGDSNKIFDAGVKINEESFLISPVQLRYERLCVLAHSWTLKDENGNDVPLNRENIKKLNPTIAIYFALGLEKALKDRGLSVAVE